MKFQIQVNLSGEASSENGQDVGGDYAPNAIQIYFPKKIWHRRDTGELIGAMDMPVPKKTSSSASWYWTEDTRDGVECYVIKNSETIRATSNHTFECTVYDIDPLLIVDESFSDTLSNILKVHVQAMTSASPSHTIWMDSNELVAQIDTGVKIESAVKRAEFFEYVDDGDGVPAGVQALVPSGNPDDYVYVKWTTYSNIEGNQPYDLALDDPRTWCVERVLVDAETMATEDHYVEEGIFLAQIKNGSIVAQLGGGESSEVGVGSISPVGANGGNSFTAEKMLDNSTARYSPTVTLWAAYPSNSFQDGHTYRFLNEDKWTVTEEDQEIDYWETTDEQEVTFREPKQSVSFTKMSYVLPEGRFLAFKYIESPKYHTHPFPSYLGERQGMHSHRHTYEMALNRLRSGEDVSMDYELLTVGYGYIFTAGPLGNEVSWVDVNGAKHSSIINPAYDDQWDSEEWIQDPEHFLNWYYVMDTSDRWDFFTYVNRDGGDPQLTGDDYQFEGIDIQAPEIFSYGRQKDKRYRLSEDNPFWYAPDATLPKPKVEVYVEYNNAAKIDRESASGIPEGWEFLGEYEVTDGHLWVDFENTPGHIVTGYRTRVTTNQAACILTTYPRITLKATDRVRGIVEQLFAESSTPRTDFRNDDNLYIELFETAEDQSIYDPDANPTGKVYPNQYMFLPDDVDYRADIWDEKSIATFTGAGYGIYLKKTQYFNEHANDAEINPGDNDVDKRRIVIHYNATTYEKSNLTSKALYDEAVARGAIVEDTSCVWYDLLPENVYPIKDTVKAVRSGDTVTDIRIFDNWRDSGRVMLEVSMDLTPSPIMRGSTDTYGDEIGIRFDAYMTWMDLTALPENTPLVNYIAYESGITGQVGTIKTRQGEPDTIAPDYYMNDFTTISKQ